eukprot:m.365473 g.365473  ORF g.365473 m.365473 type:complete len:302 (+) comp31519_c0_seq1:79-984(+)
MKMASSHHADSHHEAEDVHETWHDARSVFPDLQDSKVLRSGSVKGATDEGDGLATGVPATPSKPRRSKEREGSRSRRRLRVSQKMNPKQQTPAATKPSETAKSTSKKRLSKGSSVDNAGDIRDFFSVRPRRLSAVKLQELETHRMEDIIRQNGKGEEDGVTVVHDMPGKGSGVLASRDFSKGEFLCEYAGDLIDYQHALQREKEYAQQAALQGKDEMMCYMYFFQHEGQKICVDATHSPRIGRLINHSCKAFNLKTKKVVVDGKAHLALITTRAIKQGEELLFDYGERDRRTLEAMPWLRS